MWNLTSHNHLRSWHEHESRKSNNTMHSEQIYFVDRSFKLLFTKCQSNIFLHRWYRYFKGLMYILVYSVIFLLTNHVFNWQMNIVNTWMIQSLNWLNFQIGSICQLEARLLLRLCIDNVSNDLTLQCIGYKLVFGYYSITININSFNDLLNTLTDLLGNMFISWSLVWYLEQSFHYFENLKKWFFGYKQL